VSLLALEAAENERYSNQVGGRDIAGRREKILIDNYIASNNIFHSINESKQIIALKSINRTTVIFVDTKI